MYMTEKKFQIWLTILSVAIGVAIPILWGAHLSNQQSIQDGARAALIADQNNKKIQGIIPEIDKLQDQQIKNDLINNQFDIYSKQIEIILKSIQDIQINEARQDQKILQLYDLIYKKSRFNSSSYWNPINA